MQVALRLETTHLHSCTVVVTHDRCAVGFTLLERHMTHNVCQSSTNGSWQRYEKEHDARKRKDTTDANSLLKRRSTGTS